MSVRDFNRTVLCPSCEETYLVVTEGPMRDEVRLECPDCHYSEVRTR